jgi:single-strand DNA-binding protein
MNLNKAIVIGYLTQDPELRYTANATPVCTFTVATNFSWHDANGLRQQETEFHACVAFGDVAERIAEYMSKGSNIGVEGRLRTESWEHDDHKHYRTKIVVQHATFGARKDRISSVPEEEAVEAAAHPAAVLADRDEDVTF